MPPCEATAATKPIDPRALASITTGTLLMEKFSNVHAAIEWVLGHPVWTHELPSACDKAASLVLAQFPTMPINLGGDWKACAERVAAEHGATVEVRQGGEVRSADPITTLVEAVRP